MATTIANLTLVSKAGYDPGNPLFVHVINFDLKADYDTAGLLNFSAAVKAAIPAGKTLLGVFAVDCKGLVPIYDVAADTLKFYWGDYTSTVADGPLVACPTATMAAYTSLRLGVLSQ